MWGQVALAAAAAALATTGFSYIGFADRNMWPKAEWVTSVGWYVYHLAAGLVALFAAWQFEGLLGLLVVAAVGFLAPFVVVPLLRSWSQSTSLLALPLAILAAVLAIT